jgi:hypothetical protein
MSRAHQAFFLILIPPGKRKYNEAYQGTRFCTSEFLDVNYGDDIGKYGFRRARVDRETKKTIFGEV